MSGIIGLIIFLVGLFFMFGLFLAGIKRFFVSKSIEPINGSFFKGWLAEAISGCMVFIVIFIVSIALMWGGLSLMNWGAE